jgi:hypothetical protein
MRFHCLAYLNLLAGQRFHSRQAGHILPPPAAVDSGVRQHVFLHFWSEKKAGVVWGQKVEIQINKVKKTNICISKNNEEKFYQSNDIELVQQQYKEEDIINMPNKKIIEIEEIVNPNIIEIHKKHIIPINEQINIKIVKIKINIKKK